MSGLVTRRAAFQGSAAAALGLVGSACSPAKGSAATLSANDARLVAIAAELRKLLGDITLLGKGDPRDSDKIPGYLALEDRRTAISDALFDLRPDSMAGIVAAADIVLQLAEEDDGREDQQGHGHNLACDVLRIVGGRA